MAQAILVALPPLIFAACLTFCLSIFIRRPIIIVPLYFSYLIMTSATQAAADAKFSWLSPIVRPEYFGGVIPNEMLALVWGHQALYMVMSLVFLALAVYGFQRARFISDVPSFDWWKNLRLPFLSRLSFRIRMLWGGNIVAALMVGFIAVANTMSNPESDIGMRIDYANFGLEFYLAISGLLILAGVVVRDNSIGALNLILAKPVNRWRLLLQRLLPGMILYAMLCLLSVGAISAIYEPLPVLKSFIISFGSGIFLGIIGMTIANISKSVLAGYGAGFLFWFFEAAFDGRITAPFYLLIVSNQVDQAAGEVWRNPAIWLPVKVGTLMLAAWFFLFNGWFLDPGVKRRRALVILALSVPVIFIIGWWLIPMFL